MYMLEKLWRGELTPNEKIMRKGGPYHQKLGELCEIGDRLAEELSLEGKNLLQSYADAQLELNEIENRETFMEGFRMGAQLILDVVSEYQGEFRYSTED